VTETGSSLRANKLRIIAEILQSTTRFIANHDAYKDDWKRHKIDDIVLMLRATMAAEGKVGLMMNVPKNKLNEVIAILPALKNPTISSLSDDQWFSVSTIIEESAVRKLVPQLKSAGACGIVEYPISKIIE